MNGIVGEYPEEDFVALDGIYEKVKSLVTQSTVIS